VRPMTLPRAERDELAAWSDTLLLAVALGYAAFIGLLTVTRGTPLTPDVALVAAGFATVLFARRWVTFLREWTPFLVLFLAYELMRGLADDAGMPVHVTDLVAVERGLFGGHLPTAVLQAWLRPSDGPDLLALGGTVVYLLHFPLPIVTGLILWRWRRALFHHYLVALILLCFAGFVTYLLFPAAPPWLAAQAGQLGSAAGEPAVLYLKRSAFVTLAGTIGLDGQAVYDLAFGSINANPVAAVPSLHAAFPFLTFLVLRRAFGAIGWVAFAYFAFVALTIVYTADHYVIDVLAGVAYAAAAYLAMLRMAGRQRVRLWRGLGHAEQDRQQVPEEESGDAGEGAQYQDLRA
jgi:PAP2 superfamily protein